jgi:DNA-binding transcriptional MerR regulator
VDAPKASRLLSIGEFSAATQLSPKALRLYDEQRLLLPTTIDPATGYRYYAANQIRQGRLVRTLRDMDLPLDNIALIVGADRVRAEALMVEFAQEADRRYAERKRAFQRALAQLSTATPMDTSVIGFAQRDATSVVVHPFIANRWTLLEVARAELSTVVAEMKQRNLHATASASCSLIDPVSEEDGRAELLVPILVTGTVPNGVTVRRLAPAPLATYSLIASPRELRDLTMAMDALFDWFDRKGFQVLEPPCMHLEETSTATRIRIEWAYEPTGGNQS